MSSDIRVSVDFFDHPKTVKLQRRCGVEGVIALQRLWVWAAQHRHDGDLSGMDSEDIEIVSRWGGEPSLFFESIRVLGFLDVEDDRSCLHDWLEHNPWAAGSVNRSDKARFSNMAKKYPRVCSIFEGLGRNWITATEYAEITTASDPIAVASRIVHVSLTTVNETCTPSPPPSPKPRSKAVEPIEAADDPPDETQQQQKLRKVISSKRKKLIELTAVTAENFEMVAEHCIAHYRGRPMSADPYAVAIAWFKREHPPPKKGRKGKAADRQEQSLESAKRLIAAGPPGGSR